MTPRPPIVDPVKVLARAEDPRLIRIRRVAWVLDRSIPIGGGRRIGLDPIIGLFPGLGDAVGAALSLYVLYHAARMGTPWRVIALMILNIMIEGILGIVPILGNIFDAVWQANMRNVRLVEVHYRPDRSERRPARIFSLIAAVGIVMIVLILVLAFFIVRSSWHFAQQLAT